MREFYLNVVGYKAIKCRSYMCERQQFYLNVVGYKVRLSISFFTSSPPFYLNVVGYKEISIYSVWDCGYSFI